MRVFYEVYGEGEPTVVLLPTWSIVHSRFWKAQIHYLARHCRVITFDGRGNGRSDRPAGPAAYHPDEFALDTLAVMDATATVHASLVALSCGARWATILAAEHPERVDAIVCIGPALALAPNHPERERYAFDEPLDTDAGWAKYNSHYWRRDYRGFLEFFLRQCVNEPHSTKQIEDGIAWALDTDPEVLADTARGLGLPTREPVRETCARIACPTLVIHGDLDLVRAHAQGKALAEVTNGALVTLENAGHMPTGRDPVKVNLLLRDFLCPPGAAAALAAQRLARQAGAVHLLADRPRPCPARRGDRRRAAQAAPRPGDRMARPAPRHRGAGGARASASTRPARSSPASPRTCSPRPADTSCRAFRPSGGWTRSCSPTSWSFTMSCASSHYDLWIGDEAWDLDYFLHENPELKSAPYAWLTDFVGFLPMPDGDAREAALTADYNAEMIEQIARYPRVRDRSIFVGEPDDIVPDTFGPSLPSIREWTERHYSFCGYITGFDPAALGDRDALRARARLRQRRAGVHRHRRRLRRRRGAARARDRQLPGGEAARAAAAHGRRRRPAHRPRFAARATRGSRSGRSSPTCTGTWPPATWRSCRAG